jgi:hypothetical protein
MRGRSFQEGRLIIFFKMLTNECVDNDLQYILFT